MEERPKLFRESTLYCLLNTSNNEVIVSAKFETDKVINLLVDTGAQVSFIKENMLGSEEVILNEKIKVRGVINAVSGLTLGTVETELIFNDIRFRHKFHIINDEFSVGHDGVLGSDFLDKYRGCIDYDTRILTLSNFDKGDAVINVFVQEHPSGKYFRRFGKWKNVKYN